MFVAVTPDQYDPTAIMFSEKTKNNVLVGGDFYRIYYSDQESTHNGLYVFITLEKVVIERYFNKIKCCFAPRNNYDTIRNIKNLERSIISKVLGMGRRSPVYRIEEQLNNDYIKLYSEKDPRYGAAAHVQLLLKISGVWSNTKEYGITFRFFFTRPLENG